MIDDAVSLAILRRAKTARVATVSKAGRPVLMPLWFAVDGGRILMSNAETSPTVRNIAANPRAVVLFEDPGTNRYLRVEGAARFSREPALVRVLARKSVPKYLLSPGALLVALRHFRRLPAMRRYYRERAAAAGVIVVTPERWDVRPR